MKEVQSVVSKTATIILSEGLYINAIDSSLSDTEKLEEATNQLTINRNNCKGMDDVAAALTSKVQSSSLTLVCQDKYDDDCQQIKEESKSLIVKVNSLLLKSSQNIEDVTIAADAAELLTFIEMINITVFSFEQKETIISLTASMKRQEIVVDLRVRNSL